MRVEIFFTGGHTWTTDDDGTIHTETTRSMEDRAFYCDAQIIEHRSLDADPEGYCDRCLRASEALDEIATERARRDLFAIEEIADPAALTLEERWAPYGPEWELEQRERREGGY